MEYCSDTIYRVMKHYGKMKQPVPHIFVQLYSYQALSFGSFQSRVY